MIPVMVSGRGGCCSLAIPHGLLSVLLGSCSLGQRRGTRAPTLAEATAAAATSTTLIPFYRPGFLQMGSGDPTQGLVFIRKALLLSLHFSTTRDTFGMYMCRPCLVNSASGMYIQRPSWQILSSFPASLSRPPITDKNRLCIKFDIHPYPTTNNGQKSSYA